MTINILAIKPNDNKHIAFYKQFINQLISEIMEELRENAANAAQVESVNTVNESALKNQVEAQVEQ